MKNQFIPAIISFLLITHAPAQAFFGGGGGRIVFDPGNFSKNAASLSQEIKSTAEQAKNTQLNIQSLYTLGKSLYATHNILQVHRKNIERLKSGDIVNIATQAGVQGLKEFIVNNRDQLDVDDVVVDDIRSSESNEIPESLRQDMLAKPDKYGLTERQIAQMQDREYGYHDTYDIYSDEIEKNKDDLDVKDEVMQRLTAAAIKQSQKLFKNTEGLGLDARALNAGFERAHPGWSDPQELTPAQFDEHIVKWNEATHNAIKNNFQGQEDNSQYTRNIDNWIQNERIQRIEGLDSQLKALQFNAFMLSEVVNSLNELNKMTASHFRAQGHYWRANMLNSGGDGASGAGGTGVLSTPFDKVYREESQVKKYKSYCESSRYFREHGTTKGFCQCVLSKATRQRGFKEELKCYERAHVNFQN